MVPTEQPEFVEIVGEALGLYGKPLAPAEIDSWWRACRSMSLLDVRRTLDAHAADPEDGKRAPRPVDVFRRLAFGSQRSGAGCAAHGASGSCAYPGIWSESTNGGEHWYCPWHRTEHHGPEAERWIEISHRVPYADAMAKRIERMREEGTRAPGVVGLAHSIALKHGDKPWQRRPLFAMPSEAQAA